jgi:starch phosphorylase
MTLHAFLPRELPAGLEPLTDLALDLRWTWSHASDHLWRALDPATWETTRNPWIILQSVPRERLEAVAREPAFRHDLAAILKERHRYRERAEAARAAAPALTAYFSMEFGLSEALPLYAGGLGVLAGDLLKSASDLAVPMVGIGILYQEGYFRQTIDATGRQQELYPYNDPTALPIQPALAAGGGWLTVPVALPGRTVWLRAWRATVGQVALYLLDSNVPVNDAADRGITGKLYGDDAETRLCQEIVLGVGGWRLVEALGLHIGTCHLNEGHTAFAILERARSAMRTLGLTFRQALWATRAGNVFTTHTPVAAGFDAFPAHLLAKYFPDGRGYLAELGIGLGELLALGRSHGASGDDEPFLPAFLAMRGARHVSAVSRLHAETSRELFRPLFPRWPAGEIPIGYVTNGVHVPSWDSRWSDELWTSSCGPDRWRGSITELEAASGRVDDRTLWDLRGRARAELVQAARARLARQLARRGAGPGAIEDAARVLDPDVLTIGFARRFAEYKRPDLLLRDRRRLEALLGDTHRPVQLVLAGKAHPADRQGKALVESWVRIAGEPALGARCVFLEDYDLSLAQELVQGVDVWLNTPRRPWEACGTSGMKVLANGGLNLSVLDGWWAEAYAPELGWAIGGDPSGGGSSDADDAASLFRILEEEVVPLFYERDADGLPRAWIHRVRSSLSRLTPQFSGSRMVAAYADRYYALAARDVAHRLADGGAAARALEAWAARLTKHWSLLRFGHLETRQGDAGWTISVEVYLDDLEPGDVAVELYADPARHGGDPVRVPMARSTALPGSAHGFLFTAAVPADRPASDYTPRIVPASAEAAVPFELPLVAWHH